MANYVDVTFEIMGMRIPAKVERNVALTVLRRCATRPREEMEDPSGNMFVSPELFERLLRESPGPVRGACVEFSTVKDALNWLRGLASDNEAARLQKSGIDSTGDGQSASLIVRMLLFMQALDLPPGSVQIISRN